jgi:rod shape-determining protein MreD
MQFIIHRQKKLIPFKSQQMNSKSYAFIAYFLLLPGLQVLVFNQFDLGTQLVPHVYLLFLIFYPSNAEQTIFLVVAFFFGLYIDILHSTMGLHAAACLTAAFLRPTITTSVFGKNHGYVSIRLNQTPFVALSAYTLNLVLVHHLIYYVIGVSSWAQWLSIIKQFIFGSLYSLLFLIAIMFLFRTKK